MSTKSKTEVKELRPKSIETNYLGGEPIFNGDTSTKYHLGVAINWYNYFYDKKDSREFVAHYLDYIGNTTDAKIIRRVSDSNIRITYGWLCRSIMRGYKMTESESERLNTEIARLKSTVVKDEVKETVIVTNRPNVQEIMRERTLEAGGELEGMWDTYLKNGAKKDDAIKVIDILTQRNILPQHVGLLITAWQNKLDEYQAVVEGEDEQLTEAYNRFGKIQLRNIVNTIQNVLADLNSYINIKKSNRKPRAKKPVPVEKIVKRLKYLKNFKLEKLELEGVSPTKLHGCSEAWVYDTKKRKLHHYVADEYTKTIGVKGNALIGFCTKESEIKTLRKPETQIKEIMGSKPAARKFFNDIRATSATPNGRFNANMVILRAF
jgi:hypothetical protein